MVVPETVGDDPWRERVVHISNPLRQPAAPIALAGVSREAKIGREAADRFDRTGQRRISLLRRIATIEYKGRLRRRRGDSVDPSSSDEPHLRSHARQFEHELL